MNAEIQKELDNLVEQSMSFAKSVSIDLIERSGAPVVRAVEEVLPERPSVSPQKKFAPMICLITDAKRSINAWPTLGLISKR